MVRSDCKPVMNGLQLRCQWLGERQAVAATRILHHPHVPAAGDLILWSKFSGGLAWPQELHFRILTKEKGKMSRQT